MSSTEPTIPVTDDASARALASQRSFEAMFDHVPHVDLRTPAMVAEQAAREGWK
jgi:hypothetical protein